MTDITIDLFSGLDHKAGMGDNAAGDVDGLPGYLSDEQKRRVQAYQILRAYMEGVQRYFLIPDPDDPDKKDELRAFSDAAVVVERVAGGVLGTDPSFGIAGADADLPESPRLPKRPGQPGPSDDPAVAAAEQAAYELAVERYVAMVEIESQKWAGQSERLPELQKRQEWLQEWALKDQIIAKLFELEQEATVLLGSGIVSLGWDPQRRRVTTEILEPDFYQPVLDDQATSKYPTKVHLVWPFLDESGAEPVEMVRRITYQLIDRASEEAAGFDLGTRPAFVGSDAEWTHSVLYSNGVTELDNFESTNVETSMRYEEITLDGVTYQPADKVPIGLDFIPVVHFPNMHSSMTHFGRPFIARHAQLLDEVAATDTDHSLSSRWTARPPFAISGLPPSQEERSISLSPNSGINLGADGGLEVLDLARNTEVLGERVEQLLNRYGVNSKVPGVSVGRVDPSKVPSGVSIQFSYTPFEQLIGQLRMARTPKLELLVRFVQKIAIQNGDESIEGTEIFDGVFNYGPFMPQDLTSLSSNLKTLRDAGLVSQATGIEMGRVGGLPVDDPGEELSAIRAEMGGVANDIADATGDSRHALAFLGAPELGDDGGQVDPDNGGVPVPDGGSVPAGGVAEDDV